MIFIYSNFEFKQYLYASLLICKYYFELKMRIKGAPFLHIIMNILYIPFNTKTEYDDLPPLRVSACEVGRWGLGCANFCDKSCPNCDHRTGCCKTAATGSSIFCGGGGGGGGGSIGGGGRQTAAASGARNGTARKIDDAAVASAVGDSLARFRILSTTIRLQTATWEPEGNEANETTRTTEVMTSTRKPATTQNRSAEAETAWTPLEATALKYDELVTRLIWIFAMTLVAIAMVFVIMFVVFFKCYGTTASKPQTDDRPARNLWPEQSTGKVRGTQCVFLSITYTKLSRGGNRHSPIIFSSYLTPNPFELSRSHCFIL